MLAHLKNLVMTMTIIMLMIMSLMIRLTLIKGFLLCSACTELGSPGCRWSWQSCPPSAAPFQWCQLWFFDVDDDNNDNWLTSCRIDAITTWNIILLEIFVLLEEERKTLMLRLDRNINLCCDYMLRNTCCDLMLQSDVHFSAGFPVFAVKYFSKLDLLPLTCLLYTSPSPRD